MSSSVVVVVSRSVKSTPISLEAAKKRGDAGVFGRRIEAIGKPPPAVLEFERPAGELLGQRRQRFVQRERQTTLAEFAHQDRLVLDQQDPAVVDDADPVRHLLGLLDVMCGQDDGDALGAQPAHQRPHVAAEVDVHAGGRFIEEEHVGFVAERLGDHHPPLHAARQFDDSGIALVPQRQVAQQPLDERRIGRAAEQPSAEADRMQDGGENIERDLLRHQANNRSCGAIVAHDVVAVDQYPPRRHRHRAAGDADQRRLAGAVGAQEGENLAFGDLEIDRIERDQAGLIALGHGGDGYHRRHRRSSPPKTRARSTSFGAGRRRTRRACPTPANAPWPDLMFDM